MKAKLIVGIVLITACAGLVGCATTPKEKPTETAYTPYSERLPSAHEYWDRRDREDRAAVAKSISEGKGP